MEKIKTFVLVLFTLVMIGCSTPQNNKVDVFYIVSTNVWEQEDSYYVHLSEEQQTLMQQEMDYVHAALGDAVNFYSPMYHQLTLDGFHNLDSVQIRMTPVIKEVQAAFDEYMENVNSGHDFVLMGFSQGAMLALELTKNLTEEQSKKLIATYLLGYRLTEDDIQNPNVKPAEDATSRGVTISFNTVADTSAVWPMLSDGAAICINPITWTTDTTSATLIYNGDTSVLYVDFEKNILVAPQITYEKYYPKTFVGFCPEGNLHLGDLLFYLPVIRENIIQRSVCTQ